MHKGYAFVQFTNPFDARSACLGEDGRTVLSQILGKFSFDTPLTFHASINAAVLLIENCWKFSAKSNKMFTFSVRFGTGKLYKLAVFCRAN